MIQYIAVHISLMTSNHIMLLVIEDCARNVRLAGQGNGEANPESYGSMLKNLGGRGLNGVGNKYILMSQYSTVLYFFQLCFVCFCIHRTFFTWLLILKGQSRNA